MSTGEKFIQMVIAIGLFVGVMAAVLVIADRGHAPRSGETRPDRGLHRCRRCCMIAIGLLYPALRTIYQSFRRRRSSTKFVGLENYRRSSPTSDQLRCCGTPRSGSSLTPIARHRSSGSSTRSSSTSPRFEKFAKALIFLPMAISLVGASIIWKFVYDYKATENEQIGVLNAILKLVGLDTYRFLLTEPWNTFFLIVIMIWVQAGFAMMVLSAAIKAIPDDIVEAARLDGVSGFRMFRYITVPSIRPSLIVVLTTISIATLKVFDIVRTATGGQFDTSVLAYEFYMQSFRSFNAGLGAALAVLLFILVIPIVVYNIRQMRRLEAR